MATTPIVLHKAVMSSSVVPGAFHESGAQTSHGSAASSFNLVQSTKRSLTRTASIIPPNALVKAQSTASAIPNPFAPGGALNPTGPITIGKVNPPVTSGPGIPGVPTKITFTGPGGSNLPGPTDQGGGPSIVPPPGTTSSTGTTTTPPTTADLLNSLFGGTPTNEGGSLAVVPVQSGQASDGSSDSSSSNSKTGLMVVLFALGAGVAWYWWKHKGPGKG